MRKSFLIVALAASGCWSSTQVVLPAGAASNEMGFGAEVHTHVAYMVFASAVVSYLGTGLAAISPALGLFGDALWQVDGGGDELRYCESASDASSCRDVNLPAHIMWGDSMFIIDPVNLGMISAASQTTSPNMIVTTSAGAYYQPGAVALPPSRGIWLASTLRAELVYCRVRDGVPSCRKVENDGQPVAPTSILALMFIETAEGPSEILWLQDGPYGPIRRCESRASWSEPKCLAAEKRLAMR